MIELSELQKKMMKVIHDLGTWTTSREIFLKLYTKLSKSISNDLIYDLRFLVDIGYVVQTRDTETGDILYKAKHS